MEGCKIKLWITENNKQILSGENINRPFELCDLNEGIEEKRPKIKNVIYGKKDEDKDENETENERDRNDDNDDDNDDEDEEKSDDNNEDENIDTHEEGDENDDDKDEDEDEDEDEDDEDEDEDEEDEDEDEDDDEDDEDENEEKSNDIDEEEEEENDDEASNGNDRSKSENSNECSTSSCQALKTIDLENLSVKNLHYLDITHNNEWINSILVFLHKICESDYTKMLEEQIRLLKIRSGQKNIQDYLRGRNFLSLARSLIGHCDDPNLIDMILGIFINVYNTRTWIDIIGSDKNLVTSILMRLKLNDSCDVAELYEFLQSVIHTIRQNPRSAWISHLKECEFFGSSITSNLQNSNKDRVLLVATDLLESISVTCLSGSSFLVELFKIHYLVPALLNAFMQVTLFKQTYYWHKEYHFFDKWLQVFSTIVQLHLFEFERSNEILLNVYNIISKILTPYKYTAYFSLLCTPNVTIIQKCTDILQHFHFSNLNVPINIDQIIANITSSLIRDSDSLQSDHPGVKVLNCLLKYWASIVKYFTSDDITDILSSLDFIDRHVFIKMLMKTNISNETIEQVTSNLTYVCLSLLS